MKMIINNKFEGNSELVGIKSSEKSSNIDALFAELFALVNLDKIDPEKTTLQNLGANEINEQDANLDNSNKNTINVAKSLAEVFYKELGIDNKIENKESININNIKNINHKEINLKKTRNSNLLNDLKGNILFKKSKKESHSKNNLDINKDSSEQKEVKTQSLEIKIKKIEKSNLESDIPKTSSSNKTNKNPEISQLKNIHSDTSVNRIRSSKETNTVLKEKKVSKKKNDSIIVKNNNEKEGVQNKINKETSIQVISNFSKNTAKSSNEGSISLKNSNVNKVKSSEKNLTNNQSFNTQETLDLLESGWGEKFSKIIKNSIDKGISKLSFDLKPKNLGKIILEITVKDNKTSIQINTENQEAANMLNDNLPRLTDLIEEKNSKFSLSNDGGNHSNYFNQQKQKQTGRQETSVTKKQEVNELKKIKMSNYSIDVNA